MNANDQQVGGNHYAGAYQHWDFVLDVLSGRYLEGNITKYVARHRKKHGIQDLEKAIHYLDKLSEERLRFVPLGASDPRDDWHEKLERFCKSQELNDRETLVMYQIARWIFDSDLKRCRQVIEELIQDAQNDWVRGQGRKAGAISRAIDENDGQPDDPLTSSFFRSQEPGAGYVKQD